MLYPWLEMPFKQLIRCGQALPQGLLLTGPESIGKLLLAQEIGRGLLCPKLENSPGCGECKSCDLINAGNHPDYHLLTNEESFEFGDKKLVAPGSRYLSESPRRSNDAIRAKRVIGVEQTRLMAAELRSSAHLSMGKIVIIYPADKLNINAANALLKILEEPPPTTKIILVTASLSALPPTIRSRCSCYRIPPIRSSVGIKWLRKNLTLDPPELEHLLEIGNGSPLRAQEIYEGEIWPTISSLASDLDALLAGNVKPFAISKKWTNHNPRMIMEWLQRQILKAFRAGSIGDTSEMPGRLYEALGRYRCLSAYQKIGEYLQWTPNSIDETLFVESIVVGMLKPASNGMKDE